MRSGKKIKKEELRTMKCGKWQRFSSLRRGKKGAKERMKEELAAFADYGVPREGRRAD